MANEIVAVSRSFLSTAAFSTNPNAPSVQSLPQAITHLLAGKPLTVSASASLVATTSSAPTSAKVRVTHAGLEVVLVTLPNDRITHAGLEVVYRASPTGRITHAGLEVVAAPGGIRSVQVNAAWRKTLTRSVSAQAALTVATRTRFINVAAAFNSLDNTHAILASAEIGWRRTVPVNAAFLGNRARGVLAFSSLRAPTTVPVAASFWQPVRTFTVGPTSKLRAMSQASHLVGGSIGSYFGFPAANNAPVPLNWDQPYPIYNDSFWETAVSVGINRFPPDNAQVTNQSFDWRWPNPTMDYSPEPGGGVGAPFFEQVMFRYNFGLPNDPTIVNFTSANIQIASVGIFITRVIDVHINGQAATLVSLNPLGSGEATLWQGSIPTGLLLSGNNVLAFRISSYLSFNPFDRSTAFRLIFLFNPPSVGLPQITG